MKTAWKLLVLSLLLSGCSSARSQQALDVTIVLRPTEEVSKNFIAPEIQANYRFYGAK